jgi:hypothetical protein
LSSGNQVPFATDVVPNMGERRQGDGGDPSAARRRSDPQRDKLRAFIE